MRFSILEVVLDTWHILPDLRIIIPNDTILTGVIKRALLKAFSPLFEECAWSHLTGSRMNLHLIHACFSLTLLIFGKSFLFEDNLGL